MFKAFSMIVLSTFIASQSYAAVYPRPSDSDSLIGQVRYVSASAGDSAGEIAKRYDVGFNSIANANPQLDPRRRFREGEMLQVATRHLLPNQSRLGIVINLPEMRMYYYLNGAVHTYPIGIGKIGKTIPITRAVITRKATNPDWTPPDDIREFNLQQGIVLPRVMPPGPDNPLGPYAIYMSIPTYLIHSTIFPDSVGRRASFGCIRMYESDIQNFFPAITAGTPVVILNAPAKVGWQRSAFYLEAHEPLEEHNQAKEATLPGMVRLISDATKAESVLVDWQLVAYVNEVRDGIPHAVGVRLPH